MYIVYLYNMVPVNVKVEEIILLLLRVDYT